MGQKVHPKGLRLGINETWQSRWFAPKHFAEYIGEDQRIRKYVKSKLQAAAISRVEIERTAAKIKINIFTAKPGLVIGKKGKEIEDTRREVRKMVTKEVVLNIVETRKPDLDAQLIGDGIAFQLERRANFKRATKDAIGRSMRAGAEGIKIMVGGRLNGAEIARTEKFKEGRIPLHTLRAQIDYAQSEANTTFGKIGIQTWIFKGEKFSAEEEMSFEAIQI